MLYNNALFSLPLYFATAIQKWYYFHINQNRKHQIYLFIHAFRKKKDFRFSVIISKEMLLKSCSCGVYVHLLIIHWISLCTSGKREVKEIYVWIAWVLCLSFSCQIQCNKNILKIGFPLKTEYLVANEVVYVCRTHLGSSKYIFIHTHKHTQTHSCMGICVCIYVWIYSQNYICINIFTELKLQTNVK